MEKDAIIRQVRQEYDNGIQFRQGRVKDWQGTEDLYFGRVKKTLKGRFNVPTPVMAGFIDTLMSKIDDSPAIKFQPSEEADYRATKKVQALWDQVTRTSEPDYETIDLDGKKLSIFSGRAIFKTYSESDPEYKHCIFNTDHYDFYCDAKRGYLEQSRYLGEDNIYRSKSQLIDGANSGYYDKKNVHIIINNLVENTIKENEDTYQNKLNRLSALGLTGQMFDFQGEGMERFIESGTIVNGERYMVLWHYKSGLWLRCVPLKETFKSDLWWWTSWATHPDPFNFWSKAPADDIRPIAESIKILLNQELDNRQKRNFGQRAYDPEIFPNGAELEYRPNGLVAVKSGTSLTTAIGNGIFQFKTPELQGTINLVTWLDNFSGQKSGITAETQGSTDEKRVGIYKGNMAQVADRLGLYNKSYVKCHKANARRFVWGASEHITSKKAVKLIGEKGVEWDTLMRGDINPDVDIVVESGSADMQINDQKKIKRQTALTAISANPRLVGTVNAKWMVEQTLLNGEFTEEEVRIAMDVENNGNREILGRASEAIQEIIAKKTPKLYRGATVAFQQKIIDFASENTDNDMPLFERLIAYSQAHDEIVLDNVNRKIVQVRATQGMLNSQQGEAGMQPSPAMANPVAL